ncbi:MAG: cysteine synthase A [candidate division Zixibacteria bacterium]|nr:cysteine synthase A [candidate division Zixibacteria bacterium]
MIKMRYDSILETIFATPLVRLNKLVPSDSATLYAKIEFFNPGSSVKDRIALSMVEAAEKDGKLKPGMTIVEPTSGNTGIGLAMVAAAKGYKAVIIMPESMSIERRAAIRHFGAEIILTPASDGMKGAIKRAGELAQDTNFFQPLQFNNPANPEIHMKTTAREIIEDMKGLTVDAFVAGVGTGGTISGCGEILKKKFDCKIYAVEPTDSPVFSGGEPGSHGIQGIGPGFVPDVYNPDVVDEIIQVSNDDALKTAQQLSSMEGIFAGISSGANAWAALQVAHKLDSSQNVIFIVCDTAERYLSTPLFDQQ